VAVELPPVEVADADDDAEANVKLAASAKGAIAKTANKATMSPFCSSHF